MLKYRTYQDAKKINSLKPYKKVELIFSGVNVADNLYYSNNRTFWIYLQNYITDYIKDAKTEKFAKEFIIELAKKFPKIFESGNNHKFINNLIRNRGREITPLKKLKKKNSVALNYILDKLYVKYPVPKFLYKFFNEGHCNEIEFFFWITQGNSIKKFEHLPNIPRLKKNIHYIFECEENFNIIEAYRFCQLKSLSANDSLIKNIMACRDLPRQIHTKEREDFYFSFMEYFAKLPMFDYSQIPHIFDYVIDRKFRLIRFRVNDRNIWKPAQENLSMTNRNPNTLLADTLAWHNKLAKQKTIGIKSWDPIPHIDDFTRKIPNSEYVFAIEELTTAKELSTEGTALNHCVSSYAHSCARGGCNIFSFNKQHSELRGTGTVEKRLTIEVRDKNRIVQIRGKRNREATRFEMSIVLEWAKQNNIQISKWI
jgi:hypothetical protein